MAATYSTAGLHVLADFRACGPAAADVEGTLRAMREAVDAMGATLLELRSCVFLPQGHTAVAILAESHLAVHCWPEQQYVAVDAFTCGRAVAPEAGVELLRQFFRPEHVEEHRIRRGQPLACESTGASAR